MTDDGRQGLYDLVPDTWHARIPTTFANRSRRVIYGAVGFGFSRTWRPRRLVLLSHMRSGSSLLTQLVANNAAVDGYGELHLAYSEPRHLWALNGKVLWVRRMARPTSTIVIDKILHDHLLSPADLRHMGEMESMFLVREPSATLASLVASFGLSQTDALGYLVSRLRTLAEFAESRPSGAAIALTYDDLVHRTAESFLLLERQLGLRTPLEDRYDPMNRGGDPSANIRAGKILRGRRPVCHSAEIDGAVLDQAQQAYGATWEILASRCLTLRDNCG